MSVGEYALLAERRRLILSALPPPLPHTPPLSINGRRKIVVPSQPDTARVSTSAVSVGGLFAALQSRKLQASSVNAANKDVGRRDNASLEVSGSGLVRSLENEKRESGLDRLDTSSASSIFGKQKHVDVVGASCREASRPVETPTSKNSREKTGGPSRRPLNLPFPDQRSSATPTNTASEPSRGAVSSKTSMLKPSAGVLPEHRDRPDVASRDEPRKSSERSLDNPDHTPVSERPPPAIPPKVDFLDLGYELVQISSPAFPLRPSISDPPSLLLRTTSAPTSPMESTFPENTPAFSCGSKMPIASECDVFGLPKIGMVDDISGLSSSQQAGEGIASSSFDLTAVGSGDKVKGVAIPHISGDSDLSKEDVNVEGSTRSGRDNALCLDWEVGNDAQSIRDGEGSGEEDFDEEGVVGEDEVGETYKADTGALQLPSHSAMGVIPNLLGGLIFDEGSDAEEPVSPPGNPKRPFGTNAERADSAVKSMHVMDSSGCEDDGPAPKRARLQNGGPIRNSREEIQHQGKKKKSTEKLGKKRKASEMGRGVGDGLDASVSSKEKPKGGSGEKHVQKQSEKKEQKQGKKKQQQKRNAKTSPPQHQKQKQTEQQKQPEKVPRIICRFFKIGCCVRGAACTFSHDLKREPCVFFHFKRGGQGCRSADACPFSHDPITQEQIEYLAREQAFWEEKQTKMKLEEEARRKQLESAETKSAQVQQMQRQQFQQHGDVAPSMNMNAFPFASQQSPSASSWNQPQPVSQQHKRSERSRPGMSVDDIVQFVPGAAAALRDASHGQAPYT